MVPPPLLLKFVLTNDIYKDWKDPFRVAITLITENNENNDFHGFDKVEVPTPIGNLTNHSSSSPQTKVQGLVALEDSHENSGGFQTVPGYHLFLPQWAKQTSRYATGDFVSCKPDDPLIKHAVRISMRKGSLVVWSSRLVTLSLLLHPKYSQTLTRCHVFIHL